MGRWPAEWPSSVHMLGVGGIAMSSLGALLARAGVEVRGSDAQVYPPMSTQLERLAIPVSEGPVGNTRSRLPVKASHSVACPATLPLSLIHI